MSAKMIEEGRRGRGGRPHQQASASDSERKDLEQTGVLAEKKGCSSAAGRALLASGASNQDVIGGR